MNADGIYPLFLLWVIAIHAMRQILLSIVGYRTVLSVGNSLDDIAVSPNDADQANKLYDLSQWL